MAKKSRFELENYFKTGDRPTQGEFADLIESTININDDKADDLVINAGTSDEKFVTVLGAQKVARKSIKVNAISPDAAGNISLPATEAPLTFGTGLTRSAANAITVDQIQNITKISGLTANGYVKTKNSDGTLEVSPTISSTDLTGTALPASIIASSLKSFGASPVLTTPIIGVATGTSLAVSGAITSSSGAIGYTAGNGGTVTQVTTKGTGVTLNKLAGDITTSGAALGANTPISFTLNNTTIAPTDVIHVQHQSGGTLGAYTLNARTGTGQAIINIRNNTGGSLSDILVIRFMVLKSANT